MPSSPVGPSSRQRRETERARPIASALSLPPSHVQLIEQSHERCLALGLSRIERPDFTPLGRTDLTLARERNLRLHGHAAPVMEMLYEQIVNTSSMVVLTDATGIVIHSIGDDDFLERAAKVALAPGANWSESSKGTNAVGTALVSEMATLVHADEHFLHANHFLTCSAAPIVDPRGNILGVLDVSGDHRSYHQHTMALVNMSARMIENQWLADNYRHAMRLHFHSKLGFIGSLMEGILAVSPDGRIVGANRSALEQLGLSSAALRMQSLVSLFGTSVGALVDHFRSPLATPLGVRLDDGRGFHVHARFNWPVWSQVTEAAAVSADRPRAEEDLVPTPTASPLGDGPRGEPLAAGAAGPAAGPAQGAAAAAAARSESVSLAQLQTGDEQMQALIGKLRRVIDRDIPILVLGETGTGKELLARAIHAESSRARQPFVAVNCASIPDTLIEAELFGYEEGAFTGARRKGAVGKIQQANGGTLFLDEIGDMPLPLQAHLLRVLQERQVTPLGSTRAVQVDLAIICATHRNLRDMIDAKAFRQDLYYRLNGLAVKLPPLRERSDLAALVRRILDGAAAAPHLSLSSEAHALMQSYAWPGNVRQLFNVLRTAAVMAGNERWIRAEHLPEDFLDELRGQRPAVGARPGAAGLPGGREGSQTADLMGVCAEPAAASAGSQPASGLRPLHEVEREAIERAVSEASGNISVAAKRLGVSRNTIYRRLRWNESSSA
ncbi:MAG: sigma-54-dependent Fis family transcriptional regulator [Rubrivivax sp.]|nr:sigma-54-dependent Fis family transcriptional regulator [Rubrivivax sp.]